LERLEELIEELEKLICCCPKCPKCSTGKCTAWAPSRVFISSARERSTRCRSQFVALVKRGTGGTGGRQLGTYGRNW